MTLQTLESAGIVYIDELRKVEEKILVVDEVYWLKKRWHTTLKRE